MRVGVQDNAVGPVQLVVGEGHDLLEVQGRAVEEPALGSPYPKALDDVRRQGDRGLVRKGKAGDGGELKSTAEVVGGALREFRADDENVWALSPLSVLAKAVGASGDELALQGLDGPVLVKGHVFLDQGDWHEGGGHDHGVGGPVARDESNLVVWAGHAVVPDARFPDRQRVLLVLDGVPRARQFQLRTDGGEFVGADSPRKCKDEIVPLARGAIDGPEIYKLLLHGVVAFLPNSRPFVFTRGGRKKNGPPTAHLTPAFMWACTFIPTL